MQDNDLNKKYVLKRKLFLTLPLSLIICVATFYYLQIAYLEPKLNPEKIFYYYKNSAVVQSIVFTLAISVIAYILWLSFCSIILSMRFLAFKIPIIDLPAVLKLYLLTMWSWFFIASRLFHLKGLLKHIIDSALALEAWGLLGMFIIIFIVMEAIFLRAHLLVFYYGYEDLLNTIHDKKQYIKNIILCFITLVITTIIIYP